MGFKLHNIFKKPHWDVRHDPLALKIIDRGTHHFGARYWAPKKDDPIGLRTQGETTHTGKPIKDVTRTPVGQAIVVAGTALIPGIGPYAATAEAIYFAKLDAKLRADALAKAQAGVDPLGNLIKGLFGKLATSETPPPTPTEPSTTTVVVIVLVALVIAAKVL